MATQQRERTDPGPYDPELRRTSHKLASPGAWFTGIGLVPLIAGLLMLLLATGWPSVLGIVLIVLSLPILSAGVSLLMGQRRRGLGGATVAVRIASGKRWLPVFRWMPVFGRVPSSAT